MTEQIALMTHFADVNDPRRDQGKRHLLSDILTLTICGVVSGANTWVEIEEYGESKREWLDSFLTLPHGIPSHDTLSDVFARLNPTELEAGFQRWVSSVATAITDAHIVALAGHEDKSYERMEQLSRKDHPRFTLWEAKS